MGTLLEVDQTSDNDIISAAIELKDEGLSFAEIIKALRERFGDTYDRTRAASMVRDIL